MERESRLETQEQLHSKAREMGEGPRPAALGDKAEGGFSCGSEKAQRERCQTGTAGDTWDTVHQGHCRDSGGQPGSRRASESRGQTIRFPRGKSTTTLFSLVPDLLNICPTL